MEKKILIETYQKEIISKLMEKFGYKNKLMAPKIEKVVINIGLGRLSQQANFEDKILPEIMSELASITGQKPVPTKAKKSIASFKTRIGQIIGLKVTLRGRRMFDFIERLVKIVLPRVRDFRGIDLKNIDKNGNLTVGIKEQVVFPEINQETSKINFGLESTIVARAKNKEEAIELFRLIGIPLKKK